MLSSFQLAADAAAIVHTAAPGLVVVKIDTSGDSIALYGTPSVLATIARQILSLEEVAAEVTP